MARRRTFDPESVPLSFWRRDDVRLALARREIGRLFGLYLAAFPVCTQTQLALATQHDRSDISNFVRGTRSPRVTDIDVLGRIADGLVMPDESRVLLGLAPAETRLSEITTGRARGGGDQGHAVTGWYAARDPDRPLRIAICGSRSPGTDQTAIDAAVVAVARLLMKRRCLVDHGPMGIGIEIMTYIADHYRPPALQSAVGVFGRPNVVRHADVIVVIGGGAGTLDEVDLAISMGKRIVPYAASGGAARAALDRIRDDVALPGWLPVDTFAALAARPDADEFARIVEQVILSEPPEREPPEREPPEREPPEREPPEREPPEQPGSTTGE